jgi:hypothetical protein
MNFIDDHITAQERLKPIVRTKNCDEIYLTITFLLSFFSVIILMTWGN